MSLLADTLREFSAVAFTAGIFLALFPGQDLPVRPRTGNPTGTASRTPALLAYGFIIALFLASLREFLLHLSDHRLSSISILNTDLILNVASLIAATAILLALSSVVAHLLGSLGTRVALLPLSIILALVSIRWSAEIALVLMERGLWEASVARVSFVAKVAHLFPLMIYLEMALFGMILIAYCRKRRAFLRNESLETGINRRKSEYRVLIERRWMKAALLLIVGIMAPLLYQDLYAGRSPKLSPALAVAPGEDGIIRIRVDDVNDGELHRFSATNRSGKKMRFFLINRSGEKDSIGVVLDACALCADKGYIKKGRHVICLACGSLILIPSIGQIGGCNPIPLKHEVKDGMILIKPEDLDEGAKYFGSS